jgi:hypothetical protein
VTGASVVRIVGSPGLELKRKMIQSAELRDDGTEAFGRLGGKSVEGSYDTEVTAGGAIDLFVESIMRSAWATSVVVGFATMTTIALGTNTVTAAGGDFIATQGVRVGDIFTITGTTVSGDNNLRLPVLAIGTLTITTTPAALTTLAATATGTLTILKKIKTGTTPTRYTHSFEQYDQDTDLSELFLGCRVVGMKLSCKPGETAKASFTVKGMDRTALATGTSPYFTTPVVTTGLAMIADDASIIYNGAVVTTFTGIDLDFQIGADAPNVIGSFVPVDVMDNILSVKGTITGLRSDFSNLTLFDAETEFSVNLLLQELAAAPKPCLNVFLPRVKIASVGAPVGGQTGAKIETLGLTIGAKVAATGYDGTIATFSSSVAGA